MIIKIDNPNEYAKESAVYNLQFFRYTTKPSFIILLFAILLLLIAGVIAHCIFMSLLISLLVYISFRQFVAYGSFSILHEYNEIISIELTSNEIIQHFKHSQKSFAWPSVKIFESSNYYFLYRDGFDRLFLIPKSFSIEEFIQKKQIIAYTKSNLHKYTVFKRKYSLKDSLWLLSITLVIAFGSFFFYALINRHNINEYKNDYDESKASEFVLSTFQKVFSSPKEGIPKLYSFLSKQEQEKYSQKQLKGLFDTISQHLGKYKKKGKFLKIQKSFSMVEKGKITMQGTWHIKREFKFSNGSLWIELKVKNIKDNVWEICNLNFAGQKKINLSSPVSPKTSPTTNPDNK